ncbi:hypothetical protein C8R45DRAFT_1109830 [Mycena sanguinolenta]|nr:hypothetical protein C8R45DRAFT_1109830 [Mycena sanguinolenta]
MLNPTLTDIWMTLGDTPATATSVSDATLNTTICPAWLCETVFERSSITGSGFEDDGKEEKGDEDDKEGEDRKHPQSVLDDCSQDFLPCEHAQSPPSDIYSTDAMLPPLPPCYSDAWMPAPASTNTSSPLLPSPNLAPSLSCHSPPENILEETSHDNEPVSKKAATGSALGEMQQLEAMAAQWAYRSEGEAIAASEVLGLDLEEVKSVFSNALNWACSIIATLAKAVVMPRDATQRRSEVVKMIQNRLCEKTGNPAVVMSYKDYDKNIRGALGWQLFGWPTTSPFKAPSKMGMGGAKAIRATLIAKYSEQATDIDSDSTPAVRKKWKRVEADNIHETNMGEGKAGKRKKRVQDAEVKKRIAEELPRRKRKPRKSKRSNPGTVSNPLLTYSHLVCREDGAGGSCGSNGKTGHSSSSMKPVSPPLIHTMMEGSNSDSSDDSEG